jgi:diguanylate cyclase (GGDEF)-like protein/PAS domain S-box-containing protein
MEQFATKLIDKLGTAGMMLRIQGDSATSSEDRHFVKGIDRSAILRATLLLVVFFVFLLLTRPEVILLSKLGTTLWYPATGVAFAVMLTVSPRFFPLFVVGGAASAVFFYHQPLGAWSTIPGPLVETGAYAVSAELLRRLVTRKWTLSRVREVWNYLLGALTAAGFAAPIGAACLWADHSIERNDFWHAALVWYFGDAISVFSVAPLLLIYVMPWFGKKGLSEEEANSVLAGNDRTLSNPALASITAPRLASQILLFVLVFLLMFEKSVSTHLFYLAFVPVLWIAMEWGIGGASVALVALDFGIVTVLRFVPFEPHVLWELGGFMLVLSATTLILGAAVTERRAIARELEERTIFLKSLIGNSPFGIVVQDRAQGIQLFNDAFLDLFHYNPFEVIGKRIKDLIVPPHLQEQNREMLRQVASGKAVHQSVQCMRKDGQLLDVEVHVTPTLRAGRVEGHYIIYKNISDQLRAAAAEREYAQAVNRWASELEIRTLQLTLLNEMGAALQACGSSEEAYVTAAQSAKNLFAESPRGALYILDSNQDLLIKEAQWGSPEGIKNSFRLYDCGSVRAVQPQWSEHARHEIRCAHVDPSVSTDYLCIPLLSHGEMLGVLHVQLPPRIRNEDCEAEANFRVSQERLAIAAARQIALSFANLRLREALHDQAIRDSLTGLYNRRFMQEALEMELQRAKRNRRPLSILFLDVDHFKRFNDSFGHDAGDKVLRAIADILRSSFRAEDTVCRYGGEEFAILLPEAGVSNAAKRAEKLRTVVRDLKLEYSGVVLPHVTLSIGIAGFPQHGDQPSELLECADRCLYHAKAMGRDRVSTTERKNTASSPREKEPTRAPD